MVTLECVEKLIRKDMVDPVTGEKLTDRDIIVLQRVSGAPWPSGNPALLLEAPPFYLSPALIKPGPPQPASPPPWDMSSSSAKAAETIQPFLS